MTMALMKHDQKSHDTSPTGIGLLDRFLDDRSNLIRPLMLWPDERAGVHVEEFREDGTLVVRAELAGIDPDKDVEVSVSGKTLHIEAERKEEASTDERDYLRREIRYGSFVRELVLPEGITAKDVKAAYNKGILEVRVPMPKEMKTEKVPVTTS